MDTQQSNDNLTDIIIARTVSVMAIIAAFYLFILGGFEVYDRVTDFLVD